MTHAVPADVSAATLSGAPVAQWRLDLADRLLGELRQHTIEAWFPRTVDDVDGGFLCNFDRRWEKGADQPRMLEFQARQTRTAARLGRAFPSEFDRWSKVALHGLRFLREVMHDPTVGGWFWMVDRAGKPRHAGSKHAHSTAYLVGAGVDTYILTGVAEALEMATEGFAWLDGTVHDSEHGGYFGWMTRDGRAVREGTDYAELDGLAEPLGNRVGLKDANVHSDLLEAFELLSGVWPEPVVRERLAEVYRVATESFALPSGAMHFVLHADLSPAEGPFHHGYPLQTGSRLVPAAAAFGASVDDATALALRMLDNTLRSGWSTDEGFRETSVAARRPWWVQTEGVKLLAFAISVEPEVLRYRDYVLRLVAMIDRDLIDHEYTGWYSLPPRDRRLRARIVGRALHKGDVWKDASHEVDMYLAAIRFLRGQPVSAPLE